MPDLVALQADLLVLAGDNAEGPEWFAKLLVLLADVAPERAALAGNHDVWSAAKAGGPNSEALRDHALRDMAHAHGWLWLEEDSWHRGPIGVVGSMGWYDYSAADPRAGHSPAIYARDKGTVNADAWKIDWPQSDIEVAKGCGEGLIERLDAAAARPGCEEVVVVTHVPLFEQAMVRRALSEPDAVRWNFGNAYFGNLTLGARVAQREAVRLVVSGHSHFGGRWKVPRPSALYTEVVASDYGKPAWVVIDRYSPAE